jgi:hypothetical protein
MVTLKLLRYNNKRCDILSYSRGLMKVMESSEVCRMVSRGLVFPVSSEGPPHLIASYDLNGPWGPFNPLLRLSRGCGGPILTRILSRLTGPQSFTCKCIAIIHLFTEKTHDFYCFTSRSRLFGKILFCRSPEHYVM